MTLFSFIKDCKDEEEGKGAEILFEVGLMSIDLLEEGAFPFIVTDIKGTKWLGRSSVETFLDFLQKRRYRGDLKWQPSRGSNSCSLNKKHLLKKDCPDKKCELFGLK